MNRVADNSLLRVRLDTDADGLEKLLPTFGQNAWVAVKTNVKKNIKIVR